MINACGLRFGISAYRQTEGQRAFDLIVFKQLLRFVRYNIRLHIERHGRDSRRIILQGDMRHRSVQQFQANVTGRDAFIRRAVDADGRKTADGIVV